MTMMNSFTRDINEYTRDFDIVGGYRDQAARYLELQTGKPYEECLAFVRKKISAGSDHALQDPKLLYVGKDKNGDRLLKKGSLAGVLKTVNEKGLLMSPAMNVYLPERIVKSDHSLFIKEGVDARSVLKKAMFRAGQEGDTENYVKFKGEQENKKINNNSYSGATVSAATMLYCPSTHPSLTSTCRSATSYANAANEKVLGGNRHYFDPEVTKANILATIQEVDLNEVEAACDKYGLHYPTPEEAFDVIESSSKYYWQSEYHTRTIRTMFENMSARERAAVVYCADLRQLYEYNQTFITEFLARMAYVSPVSDGDNVDDVFNTVDRDMQLLIVFLHFEDAEGIAVKDLYKQRPDVIGKMNATSRALIKTLDDYRLFIRAFMVANTLPSNVHDFPNARRKVVAVSDTDSTMFTMEWWIEAIFGYKSMQPEATRLAFALVFIITGMVSHLLARLAAQIGVEPDKRRILSMKNEFYFKVLVGTTRAKHYWAAQSAQEGNYFPQYKLERKGVGLRGSAVPQEIRNKAEDFMRYVIDQVIAEKPIDLVGKLTEFADQERAIIDSIRRGEGDYTISVRVKPKDSYKNPAQSAYAQYEFWEQVFAPSFGNAPPPTYSAIKVSLKASNITEIKAWAGSMEDRGLADRLLDFCDRNKKTTLTSIYIPAIIVEELGIPEDVIRGIDYRKIIATNMSPFYLMAESFQAMFRDPNNERLFSDIY